MKDVWLYAIRQSPWIICAGGAVAALLLRIIDGPTFFAVVSLILYGRHVEQSHALRGDINPERRPR